jgi:flagellar motor switch protein FliG
MADPKLNSTNKAALVLLALGEELASDILKRLERQEATRLIAALASIGKVETDTVDAVLSEFKRSVNDGVTFLPSSKNFAQNVMRKAFPRLSENDIDSALPAAMQLQSIEGIEAESLAKVLQNESPQTVAITLAYCPPELGAGVLKIMDNALRIEVIRRIALTELVSRETIEALDEALSEKLEQYRNNRLRVGGSEKLVQVLNSLNAATRTTFLEKLRSADPKTAALIEEKLFGFDDLVRLIDKDLQSLISAIAMNKWSVALKRGSPQLREKIYNNLSKRAAEQLKEDLDLGPKVRVDEVEQVQQEILSVAKKLADEGKIDLHPDASEYV